MTLFSAIIVGFSVVSRKNRSISVEVKCALEKIVKGDRGKGVSAGLRMTNRCQTRSPHHQRYPPHTTSSR